MLECLKELKTKRFQSATTNRARTKKDATTEIKIKLNQKTAESKLNLKKNKLKEMVIKMSEKVAHKYNTKYGIIELLGKERKARVNSGSARDGKVIIDFISFDLDEMAQIYASYGKEQDLRVLAELYLANPIKIKASDWRTKKEEIVQLIEVKADISKKNDVVLRTEYTIEEIIGIAKHNNVKTAKEIGLVLFTKSKLSENPYLTDKKLFENEKLCKNLAIVLKNAELQLKEPENFLFSQL